jgi:hypothetical protein
MSDICQIFRGSIRFFMVLFFPCILVARCQHALSFLCVYFESNLRTSVNYNLGVCQYSICVVFQYMSIISIEQKQISHSILGQHCSPLPP